MIRRTLARLAHMDGAEIAWRTSTAVRALTDRARTRLVRPAWSRTKLLPALAPLDGLTAVRTALADGRWNAAHDALAGHFSRMSRPFPLGSKTALVDRIRRDFPGAASEASERADRILSGTYDLLGYRGLRFGAGELPDWHLDPVHGRRAPRGFWSTVPYLDPACGDHKIIWELNRHQHWLALGRAFWLTGDRRYRDRFAAELTSWLDANPPLVGINWASMLELAFRSLSWIWAIAFFADAAGGGAPWLVDLLIALDRQLTHVERNLSTYFSPNTHLLGEALALYVAGRTLPELAASGRRAATGRRILLREIGRQIAADGGHCERSTHYHRYTLDFYALALAVARRTGDDEAAARFADAVARLAVAARLLADDTGRVPHIGDDDAGSLMPMTARAPDDLRASLATAAALLGRADLQIGAPPEEVVWLLGPSTLNPQPSAISHQPSSSALAETGYFVSRSRDGSHLVIDGGPHGYQNGGHAHADALSFTFAVRGVPLLVDPGTACYTIDPSLRDRMRSTALHNTLTIDGRSQSLPSGPFHWSTVAGTQVHRWHTGDGFDYFDGSHDGYGAAGHRRRVLVVHGDLVVVADLVGGVDARSAAAHWHLDPRWTVQARARGAVFTRPGAPGDRVGLSVPQGVVDTFVADDETGLGWCSPAYGRLERTTTVRVTRSAAAPFWMASVFDLDPGNAVCDVDWEPLRAGGGAAAHAVALRITRVSSIDHVLFAEPAGIDGAAPVWRVGDVETDARMLFSRSTADRRLSRLALVDGAVRPQDQEPRIQDPCAALRAS